MLFPGDELIIGAESPAGDHTEHLQELTLQASHPWNGTAIRDLDISRRTLVALVRRKGTMLVPRGDLILQKGDVVVLYSRRQPSDYET